MATTTRRPARRDDDLVAQVGAAVDDRAVQALADDLGASTTDVTAALKAALPALLERLRDNTRDDDGAEALASAVRDDHDGSVLDDVAGAFAKRAGGPGGAILKHVFGDELDGVTQKLAASTGAPASVVEAALMALAPVALGAIAKAAIGAVTVGVVVKLLDVAVDKVRTGEAQAWLDRVGDRLDVDGDGNPVDDVARGAADLARRGARRVSSGVSAFARDERVRKAATSARATGSRLARAGAREGTKLAKRGLGAARTRLGRLFGR